MTEVPPAQPAYGIGVLARRLRIAAGTLRDWERGYGTGPSGRTAGGHWRYEAADVARVEHMRRLVLDGVPPAEAARFALARPAQPVRAGQVSDVPASREAARGLLRARQVLTSARTTCRSGR